MKLLYICDALAIYGGLERVLIDKVNWLVEHDNCEVCLLTVYQGNHPVCFPLHPNVIIDDLNIRLYHQYNLSFRKRFVRIIKLHHLFRECLARKIQEESPDCIICTRLDYVRDVVQIKGAIPLVFESHSTCLACRFEGDRLLRRLHVWFMQLAVRKAEMTVALTKGDADEWRNFTSHVFVIPNIVHLNSSGSYSDCTAKSAIFVGRFSKQKDIGSLLRIWSLVHQCHPDWYLQIYGEYGEKKDSMIAEIEHMDANVQIHDSTSHIFEEYKRNSILLLTSQYEPFGLVLPEAMSCGLPVVAFDCPYGPSDIITDGKDGFLVKNRDVTKYAEKVCLLIDNPELRKTMGMAGVQSSQRYDASLIMPNWKDLFEQLASKKMDC